MSVHNDFLPGLFGRTVLPPAVQDLAVTRYAHRFSRTFAGNPSFGEFARRVIDGAPRLEGALGALIVSGNPCAISVALSQGHLGDTSTHAVLDWWTLSNSDWERFKRIATDDVIAKRSICHWVGDAVLTRYHGDDHCPREHSYLPPMPRALMRDMTLDDLGGAAISLFALGSMLVDELGSGSSSDSSMAWRSFFNLAETNSRVTLGEALDVVLRLTLAPAS
jgi:hypothetical protein